MAAYIRGPVARKNTEPGAQVKSGRSLKEYTVIARYYWPRLLITCLGWVVSDFVFVSARRSEPPTTLRGGRQSSSHSVVP